LIPIWASADQAPTRIGGASPLDHQHPITIGLTAEAFGSAAAAGTPHHHHGNYAKNRGGESPFHRLHRARGEGESGPHFWPTAAMIAQAKASRLGVPVWGVQWQPGVGVFYVPAARPMAKQAIKSKPA